MGGECEIFIIGVTVILPLMLLVFLVSRNAEVYSLGFAQRAARIPETRGVPVYVDQGPQ